MRYKCSLRVAFCALLACCGSGRPAPILSLVQPDGTAQAGDFDRFSLEWLYAGTASAFVVEVSFGSGRAREIATVTGSQHAATVTVDSHSPELGNVQFGVRALPDGTVSNQVSIGRGIRPPTLACAQSPGPCAISGPVELTFQNVSSVADRVLLERRIVQLGATSSEWAIIADSSTSGRQYVDMDRGGRIDGAQLEYRATAFAGTKSSAPTVVQTEHAPLVSPELTITSFPQGAHLVLRNASLHAALMILSRRRHDTFSQGTFDLRMMAAGESVAIDDVPDLAGPYEYGVTASYSAQGLTVSSERVERLAVVQPLSFGLAARVVDVLPGSFAVRSTGDAFAVLGFQRSPIPSNVIVPAGDDGSGAFVLPPFTSIDRVALDANGRPHAVYAELTSTPPQTKAAIVHVWNDGRGWQREQLATRPSTPINASPDIAFDLGLDGTLHAAWFGPHPALPGALEVASLVNGAWVLEDVAQALGAAFNQTWTQLVMAGDETGAPHLILTTGVDVPVHVFRDAGGWHAESLPTLPGFDIATRYQLQSALAGAGRLTLFEYARNFTTFETSLMVVERTTSGWADGIALGAPNLFPFRAAHSADGTRVAVTVPGPLLDFSRTEKLLIRVDGTTLERSFFKADGTFLSLGFSGDGKAWVLDRLTGETTDPDPLVPRSPAPAALFEEP
jgi:hypothetical protein